MERYYDEGLERYGYEDSRLMAQLKNGEMSISYQIASNFDRTNIEANAQIGDNKMSYRNKITTSEKNGNLLELLVDSFRLTTQKDYSYCIIESGKGLVEYSDDVYGKRVWRLIEEK